MLQSSLQVLDKVSKLENQIIIILVGKTQADLNRMQDDKCWMCLMSWQQYSLQLTRSLPFSSLQTTLETLQVGGEWYLRMADMVGGVQTKTAATGGRAK